MLSARWWNVAPTVAPTIAPASNSNFPSCPICDCTATTKGIYGLIGVATSALGILLAGVEMCFKWVVAKCGYVRAANGSRVPESTVVTDMLRVSL